MKQRFRIKQIYSLEDRLSQQAQRLRAEAKAAPPGAERDRMIKLARQAETAAHMSEWLRSPGLLRPT
jgi:hypothetical protein